MISTSSEAECNKQAETKTKKKQKTPKNIQQTETKQKLCFVI